MAVPALKFEPENPVEERTARIEATVEHIQADVSDLKIGMRRLDDKIDGVEQRLTGKIDAVDQKLTTKIDAVDQKLTAKIDAVDQKLTNKIDTFGKEVMAALENLKVGRWIDRAWQLSALGGVFFFMAKAFKWI